MKISLIYLAAGYGRRFGGGKLFYEMEGKPLYQHGLEALEKVLSSLPEAELIVVAREPAIRDFVREKGAAWGGRLQAVDSPESYKGIAHSIRAGLLAAGEADYYAFCVADQPWIRAETVAALVRKVRDGGYAGGFVSWKGRKGNPAVFSGALRQGLLELQGDTGGKRLLLSREDICTQEAQEERELIDIDRKGTEER